MLPVGFFVFCTYLSEVYCQSALIPKTLTTTRGSCLLIPCQLNIPPEKDSVLQSSVQVKWKRESLWKNYSEEGFNSLHEKEPEVEVLGDLRKKDCTSVMRNLSSLHSDRYFFKLEADKYTFTETKGIRINVSDSPPEPSVTIPDLVEGKLANLTCSVSAPCPRLSPNVTWTSALAGNLTQGTRVNADGTHSVFAILNFIPSFLHLGLKVNCVSVHPVERADTFLQSHKVTMLNVTYPPKDIQISSSNSVWLGDNVTLICASNANPPARYQWIQKKEGVDEELGDSHVLSFTATQENAGQYVCEAKNFLAAVNSTLQIHVKAISFTTFLLIITLSPVLLLIPIILIIYRWCKEQHKSDSNPNIYANESNLYQQAPQLQSEPYNAKATHSNNSLYTSRAEESIYANC
ncbi:hypothetical protein DNTS_024144 [Danionella cerebrum]|uniref:Ig-like domain-containing protein n=1 Tax=Danionella cerebrum TaxID=2873325 RepID=A0A553QDR9_9TELE|nr:hypothetical protein DNTS_024144 [Danionella translucida]